MVESGEVEDLTERQRFWLKHVRAWEKAGGPMKSYAFVHGLEARSFYHWKRWLTRKGLFQPGAERPRFQQLKVERPAAGCRLHLPNGAMVEWGASLTVGDMAALVRIVGELP